MRFFSHSKITSYKPISLSSVTVFYGALSASRSRIHEPSSFPASDADGAVADYCIPHDARSGMACKTKYCPLPNTMPSASSLFVCAIKNSMFCLLIVNQPSVQRLAAPLNYEKSFDKDARKSHGGVLVLP